MTDYRVSAGVFLKSRSFFNLFFLVFLSCLMFFGCSSRTKQPVAEKGVLDLSQWNFDKNGIVRLKGEWEFYWHQLFSPKDFMSLDPPVKTGFFSPPGNWEKYLVSEKPIGPYGFATFRLKVKLPLNTRQLTLDLRNYSGAYQIWLDNQPMFDNARVGRNRSLTTPTRGANEKTFFLSDSNVVITVQKANFYGYSGPFGNILAGSEHQIRHERSRMSVMELFCLGSLVVMGIYHFFLFIFRKKDRSSLYFSFVCLLWAAYTPFAGYGGFLIWDVFPRPPLHLGIIAGLIPWYLGVPVTLMFLNSLYPDQGKKIIIRIFLMLGVVFSLVVIFTPDTIASRTAFPYEWISLCAGFYCLVIVAKAVIKKETGARIIMSGVVVMVVFVINDILMDQRIIETIPLIPAAIVILILSHSLVLARRFAKAYTLAEVYAAELEEKNTALAKMDRLKDEFLANTSHELRTPLHGIISMTRAIKSDMEEILPAHAREDLELIIKSAGRLSNLINDILDFSRLSNSDILLKKTGVDMRTMADSVLRLAASLVADKEVYLVNDISMEIPLVYGDEDRLQQVMFNLLGNAVKFTEKGFIKISASLESDLAVFAISDTGCGIAKENLERIFESFEQEDGSAARQFGGTGLGLSITRHLVELHGGTIGVKSTPGKGSEFFFSIPLALGDLIATENKNYEILRTPFLDNIHMESIETDKSVKAYNQDFNSYNKDKPVILAIDDDQINLRSVSRHLSGKGLCVVTADSGIKGIEIIKKGPVPDLVLLDIMMPKMSGLDVLKILRKDHSFSDLPVILLTARNPVTDLVLGFERGANDYLIKPFLFDELMARIRFHLDIKKACKTLKENADLKLLIADQRQKKNEARLQAQQTALEMLRFQLNPHFLFNALASIRGALLRHPEIARKMVTALAEFCRVSLEYGMDSTVPLSQELTLVKHYLEIEKIRQQDHLEVLTEFDENTLPVNVPAFLLQPLVENAIKYGLITSPDLLKIKLSANFEQKDLKIIVSNTGSWVSNKQVSDKKGTKTGLENIKKRLEKLMPDQFKFFHYENNGWVAVELRLFKIET